MKSTKMVVKYEIHLERTDPTPMNEALKHPLSDELDDWQAYKNATKEHQLQIRRSGSSSTLKLRMLRDDDQKTVAWGSIHQPPN